jgi:salicylate hydroxylase
MAPAKSFRVGIVGGGIAGITLAIALHGRQIPVDIYEQAHAFGEVGAGVSIGPNAVQAMKFCHEGIYEAFEKVRTRNLWPAKQVWFDYYDSYDSKKSQADGTGYAFSISNSLGQNGVHRASFLDEMIKLIPKEIAHFNKQLEDIHEKPNGKLDMRFVDGTSAEADVIIGCDGIKSRVRQVMLGKDYPSTNPSYTYKYAYRGLVPMDMAAQAIGEERAQNSCIHVGQTHFSSLSLITVR